MSDRPTFVDGEIYRWAEIAEFTWGRGDRTGVDPNTRFRCSKPPGQGYAVFDEIVDESPYSLVSAEEVQEAIEVLVARGLDAQGIARLAGVSADSARRAQAGNGVIRKSTRDAIVRAANGKRAAR